MAASKRPFAKQAVRTGLRWLYFVHRWLGVAACLFFAMWFLSGLVMMYVPYPSYSQEERLGHLAPIDWTKVQVGPQDAMAAAGLTAFPTELRLEMTAEEPVWRINADGKRIVISAANGQPAGGITQGRAAQLAHAYDPSLSPTFLKLIERDQWTVAGGYDRARPMYLFDLHDGKGGRLYVSQALGEVVLETSGKERFWNWLGSVPHWLYPTVLRKDNEAWRQVVMWFSGVAAVSAFTGMWIGILRIRLRPKPHQSASPYAGWMKWHHWAGLIGGLFLTTWIVSGWWSVNPFRWFDTPSLDEAGLAKFAGHGEASFPATSPADLRTNITRQARFYWVQGRPVIGLDDGLIDGATGGGLFFSDPQLFRAADGLVSAPVATAMRQTEDDDYWYTHHEKHVLPVLKVEYADKAKSWVYIDPATAQVLDINNASSRAYRWVFAGLHQLDFRPLIHHRPAWDLTLWLLGLGGVITSISGVVIGWRRLTRKKLARLRPHAVRG